MRYTREGKCIAERGDVLRRTHSGRVLVVAFKDKRAEVVVRPRRVLIESPLVGR